MAKKAGARAGTDGAQIKRIVREATRLFALKGYHATGVAEIGNAVGLGAGALYHHIGSKEELLYLICRAHVEDTLPAAREVQASSLPAPEKLRFLAQQHMDVVANRPLELLVTLREMRSLSPHRRNELSRRRAEVEQIWESVVSDGMEKGELPQLDPLFVKVAIGALNYSVYWYRPDNTQSPHEVADKMMSCLLPTQILPEALQKSS